MGGREGCEGGVGGVGGNAVASWGELAARTPRPSPGTGGKGGEPEEYPAEYPPLVPPYAGPGEWAGPVVYVGLAEGTGGSGDAVGGERAITSTLSSPVPTLGL
eukprot:TRINITY_DN7278_c0_g1_i1.p3 TRINITY_DN7278_c0_g1~~TRINITY_DN7278_c0_g1_i1.p3  ORF type:complete len:103 (-),score=5.05 TRINITY_DN7278_c0_g1_i1:256-564(-)